MKSPFEGRPSFVERMQQQQQQQQQQQTPIAAAAVAKPMLLKGAVAPQPSSSTQYASLSSQAATSNDDWNVRVNWSVHVTEPTQPVILHHAPVLTNADEGEGECEEAYFNDDDLAPSFDSFASPIIQEETATMARSIQLEPEELELSLPTRALAQASMAMDDDNEPVRKAKKKAAYVQPKPEREERSGIPIMAKASDAPVARPMARMAPMSASLTPTNASLGLLSSFHLLLILLRHTCRRCSSSSSLCSSKGLLRSALVLPSPT